MAQATTPADAKPTIRRTGRYIFETKSRTREGVTHTQDVLHLKCSCEAGAKGRAIIPHDGHDGDISEEEL